jgi:hypothetical protein
MVPMPAVIVLILCKTVLVGEPDQNSDKTGWQNREWAYVDAKMVCRRNEIQVTDIAADQGADPQPFDLNKCWHSALVMGPAWDQQHPNSAYRFWRVGCPVPIVRKNQDGTEDIIAWKIPDCGHRETVICEVDTAI